MKRRMAIPVLMVVTLVVLGVVSCTATPRYKVTVSGVSPGPDIGVTTDEKFQVVDIFPQSAAEEAGVQVGDILLDLTWIPSDERVYMPESSDVFYVDHNGFVLDAAGNPMLDANGQPLKMDDVIGFESPITSSEQSAVVPTPAASSEPSTPVAALHPTENGGPLAADTIRKDTVPFSDVEGIRSLRSYGVSLKLRVQRGEQVLELTVVPRPPVMSPRKADEPTKTPIPPSYYHF